MADRRPFCADVSRENDEPLYATASRIDHWLLVEYRGVWGHDAVPSSTLSDEVKRALRARVRSRVHARLLFIRRPERRMEEGLVAYGASSIEDGLSLTRIDFEGYEELAELDVWHGASVDHPLFLVCTHGKHDRCCARLGRPLFDALAGELDPDWVWQSSHIGGDRFAGNLVCLPEGLYYGRVDRGEALEILDEHLAGRISLGHYRGRSCYSFVAQAAEQAVRVEAGLQAIADLALADVARDGDDWLVTFATARGERYEVEVTETRGDLTYLTCSAEDVRRPRRFTVRRR